MRQHRFISSLHVVVRCCTQNRRLANGMRARHFRVRRSQVRRGRPS
jgi:hypothetical protein